MTRLSLFAFLLMFVLVWSSCKEGPKVMQKKSSVENPELSPATESNVDQNIEESLHKIIAEEVMPLQDKVLVQGKEGNRSYWVQAPLTEIKTGETYFFKENKNSLKTGVDNIFEDLVIDTLYVANSLVPAMHGMMHYAKKEPLEDVTYEEENLQNEVKVEGSIAIAELVNNPEKYENKMVQISGECTKVNSNIMGRNWIHLKDGSQDNFDLVVTSEDSPSVGQIITMQGVVIRNKDFGAGYQYDLILEQGKILKHN